MGLFGPSNYDLQRDIAKLSTEVWYLTQKIMGLLAIVDNFRNTQEAGMATLQEFVSDIKTSLTEASDEFDAKLDQLAQLLASQGQLTPEQEGLLSDLRTQARALADKVPNPPEPEPEEDLEEEEDEDLGEDPEDADPVE